MELGKKCVVKEYNKFVLATVTQVINASIFTEDDVFDVVLSDLTEIRGIASDKYRPLIFGLEKFSIEYYNLLSISQELQISDVCAFFKVTHQVELEEDNQWFNILYENILIFRSNAFSDGVYMDTDNEEVTKDAECAKAFILEAIFNKDISRINTMDFWKEICRELREKD